MKIVALLVSLMFAASVNAQEGTAPAGTPPATPSAEGEMNTPPPAEHGHKDMDHSKMAKKDKKKKKNKKGEAPETK